MIDYTHTRIEQVSVHKVGNKTHEEDLILSKSLLDTSDERVQELLSRFFLAPFAEPEFFTFTFSNEDFTMNPLYNFAARVFTNDAAFHATTLDIARHLYELSVHPQIKSGDLFLAYFTDVNLLNETVDAIGIFKSENKQTFLKLNAAQDNFSINYEDGINTEKLDKGCLIFNTGKDSGYKVCMVDKSNKSVEAQYWKDNFLMIKPCSDDYHFTKEFMNITKNFVTKKITEDFDVSRADQIDLLNRSVDYFKKNDTFRKEQFESEVFQDEAVIKSFRNYDETYRENLDIEFGDNFDISAQAVKKQSKVFKSVLKLDKNFHIYIHGDRNMIEQGIDQDGRKYYKIFYREES
ncbi:MAG: nucleoid-associated protein [Bacteroidetes bacterium]|nr:nucleoid-associated protein [Bacteroidota bacterium]MBU1719673.1 nucleoid-associated protein [Bacteroidota bacterium]